MLFQFSSTSTTGSASKATEEVIAKSLVGDYRNEHLFTLRQSLAAYPSYQQLIDDWDREIRHFLEAFQSPPRPHASPDHHSQTPTKTASADSVLRSELKRGSRLKWH